MKYCTRFIYLFYGFHDPPVILITLSTNSSNIFVLMYLSFWWKGGIFFLHHWLSIFLYLQYHPTVYSLALQSPPQILHRIWTQRSVILTEIEVKIGQLLSYNVTRVDLLLLICIFQVMSWHWCIYLPINSVFFHGNFRQSNQHLITCMLYYCAPQCIVTEIVSPKFLKHNIDIGQCFCHTAVNQDT